MKKKYNNFKNHEDRYLKIIFYLILLLILIFSFFFNIIFFNIYIYILYVWIIISSKLGFSLYTFFIFYFLDFLKKFINNIILLIFYLTYFLSCFEFIKLVIFFQYNNFLLINFNYYWILIFFFLIFYFLCVIRVKSGGLSKQILIMGCFPVCFLVGTDYGVFMDAFSNLILNNIWAALKYTCLFFSGTNELNELNAEIELSKLISDYEIKYCLISESEIKQNDLNAEILNIQSNLQIIILKLEDVKNEQEQLSQIIKINKLEFNSKNSQLLILKEEMIKSQNECTLSNLQKKINADKLKEISETILQLEKQNSNLKSHIKLLEKDTDISEFVSKLKENNSYIKELKINFKNIFDENSLSLNKTKQNMFNIDRLKIECPNLEEQVKLLNVNLNQNYFDLSELNRRETDLCSMINKNKIYLDLNRCSFDTNINNLKQLGIDRLDIYKKIIFKLDICDLSLKNIENLNNLNSNDSTLFFGGVKEYILIKNTVPLHLC